MKMAHKLVMTFLAVGFVSAWPAMSYADIHGSHGGRGDHYDSRHGDRRWDGRRDWHRDDRGGHSSWNVHFRFSPAPRHYFYERTVFVPPPVVTYYEPPVTVIEPAPVVAVPVDEGTMNEFTVNVPNSNGTYTAVVIRRSGQGYVGPQGEFYYAFPPVAQLRAVYGI